jgi:hypothetical protein
MDRVYSSTANYNLFIDIFWIQAILNINSFVIVIWIHTQWPIVLSGLYKIYRCFELACIDSIVWVMYNRPKWQRFRLEHLDTILADLYGHLGSCFQEILPILYKKIAFDDEYSLHFTSSNIISAIRL